MCLIDGALFPSKVNNKCPAITFAVKRTASVPGRIKLRINCFDDNYKWY
jgi:hypothetical protein